MPRELELLGGRRVRVVDSVGRAPADGEVRVEALLSGISSGTELRHFRVPPAARPVQPGYEFVGRVVEAISDGNTDLVGTLVWLDRPHASEAVASAAEARAGQLPDEAVAPPGRFAFLGRTRTALNAVHDGELRVGERVLVVGLGAVGALIARIAVLAGAEEVAACDPIPARRRLAERWGAQPTSVDDLAGGTTSAADADVVFEASGNPDAFATASACCASHGRIVVVSTYAGAARLALPGQQWAVKQPTIAFSTSRPGTHARAEPRWNHMRLLAAARHLLSSGRITAEDLVTATLPFDRAADAYRLLEKPGDALCAMLDYGATPSG